MAILSQQAYARHRGVVLSAVQKAIQSHRIPTLPDARIDADVADAEWKRNTTVYTPAVTRRTDTEEEDGAVFGLSQYTQAGALREHSQAGWPRPNTRSASGSWFPRTR